MPELKSSLKQLQRLNPLGKDATQLPPHRPRAFGSICAEVGGVICVIPEISVVLLFENCVKKTTSVGQTEWKSRDKSKKNSKNLCTIKIYLPLHRFS
jgi:hypothetical protein